MTSWADIATVTLLVGETKAAFIVHEEKLFEASSFFKAAFTSDFKEGSERTMTLPEDDEAVFDLFVEWLYYGSYQLPSLPAGIFGKASELSMQPVQLFVLADKYDVPQLKNLILLKIFLAFKESKCGTITKETFAYAFQHTPQKSSIRKLFADWLANYPVLIERETSQIWLREHPEISTDLNVSLAKRVRTQWKPFEGEIPEEYLEKAREDGK